MKRTFKSFSAILLALVMLMSVTVTAFAADSTVTYKSKGNWEFYPGSGYTSADLFDGFKNVIPGDKRTEVITIKNESAASDYIKVYLQAVVHDENGNLLTYDEKYENADGKDQANVDGQRDETVATMHDFLSQLTMRVWNGEKLIYEASPDELNGLTEPVLLTSLYSGKTVSLNVELEVPIEMGNEFAYRVGEVDWKFLIEEGNDSNNNGGGDDGGDTVTRTVYKLWEKDDESERPENITVTLTCTDRETGRVVEEKTAELNAENQWTCSWTGLDSAYQWDVKEINVPDGYQAGYKYSASGHVITITNTGDSDGDTPDPDTPGGDSPDGPVFTSDLTVVKAWDDDNNPNRPSSVTLQLYNGSTEVETITLTEADGWTYTWEDLAAEGEWRVIEVDIPDGYTPVYSAVNGVITITNTATLINTGQMNWPVPVLGGLGVLVLASGIVLMRKKKDHAAE